jgi:hypothetical protein
MEKIILLVLAFASNIALAQNFAPVGAKWHYNTHSHSGMTPITRYTILEVIKDSIIQEKYCTVLSSGDIFHEDDGKVFIVEGQDFNLLFDFNAQPGDSWQVKAEDVCSTGTATEFLKVENVDIVKLNGKMLKRIWVRFPIDSYWGFEIGVSLHAIIETIGPLGFMFPQQFCMADAYFNGHLRCYEDNYLGKFETGIVESCTYTSTGVAEIMREQIARAFPNPSTGRVFIEGVKAGANTKAYNLQGQLVGEGQEGKNGQVYFDFQQKGIFFIQVTEQDLNSRIFKIAIH